MNSQDSENAFLPSSLERYSRQIRFSGIGVEGQRRLACSTAVVMGCGALGSFISNALVRAGVGHVRIIDRDFVETSNLQRQVLFDERDVASNLPKAIAAADKLKAINSTVDIEAMVEDVDADNVERLIEGADVILDGTDNFEIRFLINDASVKHRIPWVYGGCLGADGQTMTIVPETTPCLHCLMLDGPPAPGTTPTCDSAGILSSIIGLIASMQVNEAIKIMSGDLKSISRALTVVQLWDNQFRTLDVSKLRERVDCPTCKHHRFEWLSGKRGSYGDVLCGRNAVQLSFADREPVALDDLAKRLQPLGKVEFNRFLLKFSVESYVITVFPNGRAIISGTGDIATARKLYTQFIGT